MSKFIQLVSNRAQIWIQFEPKNALVFIINMHHRICDEKIKIGLSDK